ncbi:Ketopantoate reductase [Planctomycetales bacterium 10988]|nr:Ketopantoate reductase [Planctomycetales bacterium 10988]
MKIGIMGAGAIGCYLGGSLQHAGHDVTFVGREGLAGEVQEHGLRLTHYQRELIHFPSDQVNFVTAPESLAECDAVLVSVKGTATQDVAAKLSQIISPEIIVVSFQNGVRNAEWLKEKLPKNPVFPGTVSFHVLREPQATFHFGTSGNLYVGTPEPARSLSSQEEKLIESLKSAGFKTVVTKNIAGVQWCKLLFNLNNAVNALSGVPLKEELSHPGYRRVLSACMLEGLEVLDRAKIRPVRVGGMLPRISPRVLPLPNWLFFRLARTMISIDPESRSSMWDDLHRGRKTEIELLNGEIVRLGSKIGYPTPINQKVVQLIRAAEEAGNGSPAIPAETLEEQVLASRSNK